MVARPGAAVTLRALLHPTVTAWPVPIHTFPSGFLRVSARELEVLHELAAGLRVAEIATRLDVRPATVESHLTRLYSKLDAGSGREAVATATRLSLLAALPASRGTSEPES